MVAIEHISIHFFHKIKKSFPKTVQILAMMPLNGCLPSVLMSRIDENTWFDMKPVTQYHAGAIKAISFAVRVKNKTRMTTLLTFLNLKIHQRNAGRIGFDLYKR